MAFVEDRDIFFLAGDPGIVTAVVGSTPVLGEFHDAYVEEFGIEGYAPVFKSWTASLPVSHGQGISVVIASVTYRVVGVQPNNTFGTTRLVLEHVSG